MTVTGIIFERGVEWSQAQNSVKLAGGAHTVASIIAEGKERYGVRPILLTEVGTGLGSLPYERHGVLSLDGREWLGLRLSSLQPPDTLPKQEYSGLLLRAMDLQYVAGAMLYHCQELALHYSGICNQAVTLRQARPIDGDHFSFGGRAEALCEDPGRFLQCPMHT